MGRSNKQKRKNKVAKPTLSVPRSNQQKAAIPQTNNNSTNNQNSHQDLSQQRQIINEKGKDGWDKATVLFNGIMAIGTIIAIVISAQSLRSSNEALKLTRESIRESNQQFESQNKPFLECDQFQFDTFEPYKEVKILFRVKNMGNYPAKVIRRRFGCLARTVIPPNPFDYIDSSIIPKNTFSTLLTKETPAVEMFTTRSYLLKSTYDSINKKLLNIYFFGEIVYENQINGEKKAYTFKINIQPPPSIEYNRIYGENTEVSN